MNGGSGDNCNSSPTYSNSKCSSVGSPFGNSVVSYGNLSVC